MGRVVNRADYTFDKIAKTITFSSKYTGVELSQIQLITDVTNTTVIYQFNKTGFGGTLSGLVLTLAFDTTGAGFSNTDDLMIIINESQDNTQLYSGILTTTGSIAGIDTTDFQTVSIQVSGSWEGVVNVEGSNDNSYYVPLMVYPINEFTLVDSITEDGIFNLTTSTRYIRLNVVQLQTGSINALIHGRLIDGPNAADALSMAMDRTQNMPLNTLEANPLKRDVNNALVQSDIPFTFTTNKAYLANEVIFQVDTTGYQSLDVIPTSLGSSITVQVSNDGINWIATIPFAVGQASSFQTQLTTLNVNQLHSIPCLTRYIRLVANAGLVVYALTAVLKNTAAHIIPLTTGLPVFINSTPGVNITQVGGSTQPTTIGQGNATNPNNSTPGFQVGAPIANIHGSTTVSFPVTVGGRQAPGVGYLAGISRTMLMDSDGRVQIAADQTKALGTGTSLQVISSNFENGNSLSVTDLSQFEGQTQIELLAQILLEMRITNRYLSELPLKLNAGLNNLDEPEAFRQDQTFFNT